MKDKKLDIEFEKWVPGSPDLGLDDIHYVALNALTVLSIFLVVVDEMKKEIDFFSKIEDMDLLKKPKILLDVMCENSIEKLRDMGINFEIAQNLTCKGKFIFLNILEVIGKCEKENLILVTSDKFLIGNENVKNVIVYKGRRSLTKGLKKFMKKL